MNIFWLIPSRPFRIPYCRLSSSFPRIVCSLSLDLRRLMCARRGLCFADDVLITESLSVTKLGIVALILQTTVSVSLLVDVSFVP